MAKQLLGKNAAAALDEKTAAAVNALKKQGVFPKLAIVRCGEKPSDVSYEKGILTRAEKTGIAAERFLLPENASKEDLIGVMDSINGDDSIHGCLLFRPLPETLRAAEDEICSRLRVEKDVDCMTGLSCAGVFTGKPLGFPPCTPQACLELLDHYGIDCAGKSAVVIGRSLVVGKPVAMLLLQRNATVTICHTKTRSLAQIAGNADIIVSAAGALGSLTRDYVRQGQTVLDVSVNWDAKKPNTKGGLGAISGDALYDEVAPVVDAITPVPGGVGSVTVSVLLSHVVEAAERLAKNAEQTGKSS